MKTKSLLLLVSALFFNLASVFATDEDYVPPTLPTLSNNVFNIVNFGAKNDTVSDNTKAIQSAIDAANKAGGGKVIVPAGTYLCGPLTFVSNLNLHLDEGAILLFLPINRYPGGLKEGKDFIFGKNLHDVAITGKGTIDGQGSPWWPFAKVQDAKRPRMIALRGCDKVLLEDVTLMNSPKFHIAIGDKSSNVTVNHITVRAPASDDPVNPSHNTDACDVTGNKILIQNCDISVGDDNYTCAGGTTDVMIRNNKYGYGHGLSIGSYAQGVSNITVENCTFTNTECGIRIKSDRDRGGIVENITYKNLTMNNVEFPILIYAAYNAKDKKYRDLKKLTPEVAETYPADSVVATTPIYRNITFKNITATTQPGMRAGLIWGLPEAPASDITLENVNIKADRPFGIYFVNGVTLINCDFQTKEGKNVIWLTNSTGTMDGKPLK